MKLVINGREKKFESQLTITLLLDELGLKTDRVAVEVNHDLIPRERWATTKLSEGDKLEIVQFVGGGTCQGSRYVKARSDTNRASL